MNWTSEAPEKSGLYWIHHNKDYSICSVVIEDKFVWFIGDDMQDDIESVMKYGDVLWYGPILPPPIKE